MNRAILLVMDSVGIGGAPDAADFGDEGANTLGHIAEVAKLSLPNLCNMGLGNAAKTATGTMPRGLTPAKEACFAAAEEVSPGKDTPTGHWEIAGVPIPWDWHHFPDTQPCFPTDLIAELVAKAELPGILGDKHASGTVILDELGAEHIRTGKPIVYTSADSVVQIAAHEAHFGLERLYDLCRIGADIFHPLRVGRVIARPFIGEIKGQFTRTPNRKDFSIEPPEATLCDRVVEHGGQVHGVGKIGDIFAHRGISTLSKAKDDMGLFDATLALMDRAGPGELIFANFVDFDTEFGHRRDPAGYAGALERFDARLPELCTRLQPGDLLCLTADHGNDPTWRGTDHTRERVPALFSGPAIEPRNLGVINFADIGETLAAHLGLAQGHHGKVLF